MLRLDLSPLLGKVQHSAHTSLAEVYVRWSLLLVDHPRSQGPHVLRLSSHYPQNPCSGSFVPSSLTGHLLAHQGNLNLVVRADWGKVVPWITLQQPLDLHMVNQEVFA